MVEFDVVELPAATHPEPGETAPEFTRPLVDDEYWADASLSELVAEGPVALVFHPMNGSFPATYTWNEIRDREWGGRLQVVGVSVSTPYAHKRLIEEREMDYRLFSDPQAGLADDYGVAHDLDGMTGVTEHRPAVFLIDENRTVRYAWVSQEWPEFPDYDEIETAIDDLRADP